MMGLNALLCCLDHVIWVSDLFPTPTSAAAAESKTGFSALETLQRDAAARPLDIKGEV
jgi:hypothetical protein